MTIALDVPEMVDFNEFEAKMILAGEFYTRGRLSLGQAAKLVGVSKQTFIETMGDYGYSVFGENVEDLISDIENA